MPVGINAIRLVSRHLPIPSGLISIAPIPEIDSFDISNDKWLLSQWVNDYKIPHPKTLLFSPDQELKTILESLNLPIFIKPKNGRGGQGIKILTI